MRDFLNRNLYQLSTELSFLIAGGIAGYLITAAVDGQDLLGYRYLIAASLFCVASLYGLGYGALILYPYRLLNKKLQRVAIYAPYPIKDTINSSWIQIDLPTMLDALRQADLRIRLTRNFLEARLFPVIVNPYGGAYPEEDLQEFSDFDTILKWVKHGGIYINIADIPFYYARTSEQRRLIDTTPPISPYVPERRFEHTLLTRKLGVAVLGIDPVHGIERLFDLKAGIEDLWDGMSFSRAFGREQIYQTPMISVQYGKGCFVFSTIQLTDKNVDELISLVEKGLAKLT